MKLDLTRGELFDLIDDSRLVKEAPWKWGTRDTYVTERDGKHYQFTVECHREEGLMHDGPLKLTEVHEVEKTIKVWEPVPLAGTEGSNGQ